MSGESSLWRVLVFGLLAAALVPAMAAAAEEAPTAVTLEAVRLEAPPTIDGDLDDPCWQQAAVVRGFWRTDKELPATEPTEAYLAYDDGAIYVAFRCRDSRPDEIRAQERRRDGDIWRDDRVSFMLDPDHDAKNFWEFTVTALGTQSDYIPGGSAAKIEWRGDWTAASQRSDDGWTCEIRLPFEILRYPRDATCFHVVFTRYLARDNEQSAWPNLGTTWRLEDAADWIGLSPPVLKPRPLVMPYAIADLGDTPGKHFDLGLDIKHRHPIGLTTLAAVNPDYSQIEDVVSSIAFSYREPWLRETRPFFAEGLDAYYPGSEIFYSRRVGDIDAGLKTFGTIGRTDIGLLEAYKQGEMNAAVASVGYHYTDLSTAGIHLVDRQGPADPHNFTASLRVYDAHRRGENTRWIRWWQDHTHSADARGNGTNLDVSTGHDRPMGHWDDSFQFRRTTSDFCPALARPKESGVRGGSAIWHRYDQNLGNLEWRYLEFHNAYFKDDQGEIFKRYHIIWAYFGWRNGRELGFKVAEGERERYDLSDVSLSYGWRTRDLYRSGSVYALVGNCRGGDYRYFSLRQGFKPAKDFSARIEAEYARLTEPAEGAYSQYQVILSGTYEFTPEKHATLRFVQRRDGTNVFASYRQRVRRGTDIYLLVGDPNPAQSVIRTRLALKVIMMM